MVDVARVAGVSTQTVSRTLSHPDRVSADARRKVESAIKETGYLPNLAASHLASNRSRTIAAILPAISTSIFSDTLHAAAERLAPAGYQLFVGNTDYLEEREAELVRSFIQRRPDAFFIVGTLINADTLRQLSEYGAPVVETWEWNPTPADTLVGFSNRDAAIDMVRHLVDKGHRAIAFGGVASPGDPRAANRLDGFTAGIRALLPEEPLRVVTLPGEPIAMDTGARILTAALERHPEITALMFTTDILASGALLASQRQGIDVPGRLAITGFGDFEIARHLNPSLTTVSVDAEAIGTQAADLLLTRLRGDTPQATAIDVGYRIMARESA
ncbi:MAG: LacI family DNA-binding transcriptional regulator [Mycobacterium sp.]